MPPRPKAPLSPEPSQPSTSPAAVSPSPSSRTTERPRASPSCSDSGTPGLKAVALYDFEGDESLGDLVFRAGETIVDVRNVSAEWMSGRIGDRTGNFPTAFIQIS